MLSAKSLNAMNKSSKEIFNNIYILILIIKTQRVCQTSGGAGLLSLRVISLQLYQQYVFCNFENYDLKKTSKIKGLWI